MRAIVEWFKDTVSDLGAADVIVGIGIGVIIFCILLLVVLFFSLFGPVVIAGLFVLLLCVAVGILIAGSL